MMPSVGSSLTSTGVLWSCVSLASSLLNCAGFYLPFWLKGSLFNQTEVTFGSFRRCNYPYVSAQGTLEMVYQCGRYTSFHDIPSLSWQVTTLFVGIGAATSLFVAFTALASCCIADVITKNTARTLGLIQLIAAIFMLVGGVIYPNGLDNPEVKEACGGLSEAYRLGTCELSWSMYLMTAGMVMLLLCSALSLKASRIKPHTFRI